MGTVTFTDEAQEDHEIYQEVVLTIGVKLFPKLPIQMNHFSRNKARQVITSGATMSASVQTNTTK